MEITSMTEALQLQAQILKSNNNTRELTKLFTFSALSSAGDLAHARLLLLHSLHAPTSFHYNTLLRAYSRSPDPAQALLFFTREYHLSTRPDHFTFPFLLKSCARLRRSREGKQIHGLILKLGLSNDRYISHSLIHMYAQCSDALHARQVFDAMTHRDVVSWTAMIDGLVDNDRSVEAIALFGAMERSGVAPNGATVVAILRACAEAGALGIGKWVHAAADEAGIGLERNVRSALIDMYAKCGCVESARGVFVRSESDVFAYTAMISGLASHGMCDEAVELFDAMVGSGITPDERTMTAVLSACRNAGRVTEAFDLLNNMHGKYGVRPNLQHYGCVADLLARAGRLAEAEEFVNKMPVKPDAAIWRGLIWACKAHSDTDRAERLTKRLGNSGDCGSLVLIGNVYAAAGKWREKARARAAMEVAKPAGSSRIEIGGEIHSFAAGDSTHNEAEAIYAKLSEIEERVREEGHVPRVREVMLEIGDGDKARQLSHHSEKLAVAYGLIGSGEGSVVRIAKNLRSCEDCHAFMKAVSRVYRREIVVRDRIRFHRFSHGNCSCNDFW